MEVQKMFVMQPRHVYNDIPRRVYYFLQGEAHPREHLRKISVLLLMRPEVRGLI
jgi:hypothetical protein